MLSQLAYSSLLLPRKNYPPQYRRLFFVQKIASRKKILFFLLPADKFKSPELLTATGIVAKYKKHKKSCRDFYSSFDTFFMF